MTKQLINIGEAANDRKGDSLRTAFTKINGNFGELYTAVEGFNLTNSIPSLGGNNGKYLTNDGATLSWAAIPATTELVNNGHTLSVNSYGQITVDGDVFFTAPVITVDHIPPAGPVTGNLWYDTESGRTYVYFDTSWVDANPRGPISTAIPNQTGQGGKVLTTDGSNLSWTTVSGGSTGSFRFNNNFLYTQSNQEIYIDPSNDDGSTGFIYIPGPNEANVNLLQIGNQMAGGVQISSNDNNWIFRSDGALRNNNSFTKTSTSIIYNTNPAVVWTASEDYISGVKLMIQVEASENGDNTGWHSQVCEAVIASRGYANGVSGYGDPAMAVYGVTHTSTVPLVTFAVQRNPTTKLIEVVGTPAAEVAPIGASLRIYSVETATMD